VQEANDVLGITNATCKEFGLNVSFGKTKTQVFNNKDLAEKPSLIRIEGVEIENVREFTYLGQLKTTKEKGCFTDLRTARAIGKFNELRGVLTDTNVHLRTRRKFLESCVRARLLYSTEVYLPTEKQATRLETCWNQLQRSMVKGGWDRKEKVGTTVIDFAFKYSNADIAKLLKTNNLRDYMHERHLRYIGHCCRLPNSSLVIIMLFATPQRKYY